MAEQKSFRPTKKRLDKARKEGNVRKSQLLTQSVSISVIFAAFVTLVRFSWVRIALLLECVCMSSGFNPGILLKMTGRLVAETVGVCLLSGVIASLVLETWQVGFKLESSIVAPRLSRLAPASGIKKIFSGLAQIWLKTLFLLILCFIFYWFFKGKVEIIPQFFTNNQKEGLGSLFGICRQFLLLACVGLIGAGCVDYFFQNRKFLRQFSMSGEEIRREHKEMEGDPQMKAFRKSLHQEVVSRDMIAQVRRAKVIIVERA